MYIHTFTVLNPSTKRAHTHPSPHWYIHEIGRVMRGHAFGRLELPDALLVNACFRNVLYIYIYT